MSSERITCYFVKELENDNNDKIKETGAVDDPNKTNKNNQRDENFRVTKYVMF